MRHEVATKFYPLIQFLMFNTLPYHRIAGMKTGSIFAIALASVIVTFGKN